MYILVLGRDLMSVENHEEVTRSNIFYIIQIIFREFYISLYFVALCELL